MADIGDMPTIQTISISDSIVEISYVDPAKQTTNVMEVTTIGCYLNVIEEAYAEFADAAQELLDAILLFRRNPPLTAGRPRG